MDPFSLLDRRAIEGELLARVRSKKKLSFELSLEQKLSLAKAGLQEFENGGSGVQAVNGKEDLRALFDNFSSCALEWTEDNQIKNDYEFVHKGQRKQWTEGEEDIVRFGFIINDGEKMNLSVDYSTEDFSHLDLMYMLKLCAYENSFCGFKKTPVLGKSGQQNPALEKATKDTNRKEQSVSLLGKEMNTFSEENMQEIMEGETASRKRKRVGHIEEQTENGDQGLKGLMHTVASDEELFRLFSF